MSDYVRNDRGELVFQSMARHRKSDYGRDGNDKLVFRSMPRRKPKEPNRDYHLIDNQYRMPRRVQRYCRKALAPLALMGRPRLLLAVQTLLLLIGRYHTTPTHFDARGCAVGPDGGFLLDRRGLTGPNAPKCCQGLTERLVRDAITYLLNAGIIERVSPKATFAREDKLQRHGFWLPAKKRLGQIKAPPVRYRLGRLLRALFSKTLKRLQVPEAVQDQRPVGVELSLKDMDKGSAPGGVTTGRPVFYDPDAGPKPLSRAEIAADLERRRRERETRDGRGRPAIPKITMVRPVFGSFRP